jgi:hypothetical protein
VQVLLKLGLKQIASHRCGAGNRSWSCGSLFFSGT